MAFVRRNLFIEPKVGSQSIRNRWMKLDVINVIVSQMQNKSEIISQVELE